MAKKRPVGRPKIKIDWKTVDKLLFIQATGEEIAGFLDIEYKTLQRKCLDEKKKNFVQYSQEKRGVGKISLRRHLWQQAEKNPTSALWLSKQHLGFTDKVENKTDAIVSTDDTRWKLEITHVKKADENTNDQ